MAKELLDHLLDGSISYTLIIECIKADKFDFTIPKQLGLEDEQKINVIEDFVPFFVYYIRTNLSSYLSPHQAVTCSPKRRPGNKKSRIKNGRKGKTSKTSLLSKYSPGPRASQTTEKNNNQKDGLQMVLPDKRSSETAVTTNQCRNVGMSKAEFSHNGNKTLQFTRHISRPANKNPKTQCVTPKETKSQFQKRRIAPTLITSERVYLQEDEDTKALFANSPVLEVSESSLDSDGSPAVGCSNEKMKRLEKKMKKGRKGPTTRLPLSAFLTSDSNNLNEERSKCTPLKPLTPDVHKIYQQRLVSSPIETDIEASSSEKSADFQSQGNLEQSNGELEDFMISLDMVKYKDKLKIIADLYECILMENLVSNLTMELYFLFGVINCKSQMQTTSPVSEVFGCVENCVFFAAKMLEKVKKLFIVLDAGCLKLICDNQRLCLFEPAVVNFAQECLKMVINNSCVTSISSGNSRSFGVPFQVEQNNRKSFSSDRYFYSFSKLRDKFYGLIRIWEENHFNEDWNIEEQLSVEFTDFFHGHSEFPTYAQFSQLFVCQLIEMCGQDFSSTFSKDENISTNFLSYLKNADPAKFQLLQERFNMPATSHDPCPKPYFNDVENFFRTFIRDVDSYQFNTHLKDTLMSRLLDINSMKLVIDDEQDGDDSEALALMRQDFSTNISEARILAKFLGFVVFLPYSTDNQSRKINIDSMNRQIIKQPFDPNVLLEKSLSTDQLLVTVPWLVMYLSMMDLTSLQININKEAFQTLVILYRERTLRLWQEEMSLNKLFILIQLGWLFDQPNIAAEAPFLQLVCDRNFDTIDQPLERTFALDKYPVINKSLLIRLCPYVSEIKHALSITGAKSYKKITPVTQKEAPVVAEEKQLRDKLIESFLKYQPKYVKDSVNFLVERFFSNLKHQIIMSLMPGKIQSVIEYLEHETNFESEGRLEIDAMKATCNDKYVKQMTKSRTELIDGIIKLALDYCNERSNNAVSTVFPTDIHERVIDTAARIVSHQVKTKVSEWIDSKLLSMFETDLDAAFNRFLMNILKSHNKSLTSSEIKDLL